MFVSYSHADAEYLKRLRTHLRPFEREGAVEVWADTKIKAGSNWRANIRTAINQCAVAILLISADFLASDFIAENELPPLLKRASEQGVTVLPVILKASAFLQIDELSEFQAANDASSPIASLPEHEQEELWVQVAISAKEALDASGSMTHQSYSEEEHPLGNLGQYVGEELDPLHTGIFNISEYHVYTYYHIDELGYMPSATAMLSEYQEIIEEIKLVFRSSGWEGDGQIQVLWLPPFLGAGMEDTFGVVTFHVKQSNNGTSFIASPVPLPFSRLLEYN